MVEQFLLQRQDALSGRGYQGHFGTRMSFGIPESVNAVRAEVIWPDGITQTFPLELDKLNKLEADTAVE